MSLANRSYVTEATLKFREEFKGKQNEEPVKDSYFESMLTSWGVAREKMRKDAYGDAKKWVSTVELAAGLRAVRDEVDLLGLTKGDGALVAQQDFQVLTGPSGPVIQRQDDGSGDTAWDKPARFDHMKLLADLEAELSPPGMEDTWQKMMERFRKEVATRSKQEWPSWSSVENRGLSTPVAVGVEGQVVPVGRTEDRSTAAVEQSEPASSSGEGPVAGIEPPAPAVQERADSPPTAASAKILDLLGPIPASTVEQQSVATVEQQPAPMDGDGEYSCVY